MARPEERKIERREPAPRAGRFAPARHADLRGEAARRFPDLAEPPAALGEPGSIHEHDGGLAFVYAEPDVLVQRFPARVGGFIEKTVGGGARLERLRVGGDPAYWIEGAHGFAYRQRGAVDFEDQRIAGNTLLVERADGELIRVEGGSIASARSRSLRRSPADHPQGAELDVDHVMAGQRQARHPARVEIAVSHRDRPPNSGRAGERGRTTSDPLPYPAVVAGRAAIGTSMST